MKIAIVILSFIIISCNSEKRVNMFVVPDYNEKYLEDSIKYAPYDYYGPNNVIIMDAASEFFYHDNSTSCGTGWKVTNPPREINFEKNPLLIFKTIDGLIEKINQTDKSIKLVMLASNTDTIRNQLYFDLKRKIQQCENIHIVATRKITNDEKKAILNK